MSRIRGRLSLVAYPFVAVALVGVATTLVSSSLLLRGPFFDGPRLQSLAVLYAVGGFMGGIIVASWAGSRAARL
ncbi:MAG: hypothetical protein ABEJ68_11490 [Halobacteriaceae archaeon]